MTLKDLIANLRHLEDEGFQGEITVAMIDDLYGDRLPIAEIDCDSDGHLYIGVLP